MGRPGRRPGFWWRDDDAVAPGEALDRLLALAERHGRQVALAVIPEAVEPALAERLAGTNATVIQHGWAHRSHAPAGEKNAELGDHRPAEAALAELAEGRARLERLFGDRFHPALAPPWEPYRARPAFPAGRGRPDRAVRLRPCARRVPGLHLVNTHADPVDWRGSRGFAGVGRTLAPVLRHLADRRTGAADPDEPTGILTHHLVHDLEGWIFPGRPVHGARRPSGDGWIGRTPAPCSEPGHGPTHRYAMAAELGGDFARGATGAGADRAVPLAVLLPMH